MNSYSLNQAIFTNIRLVVQKSILSVFLIGSCLPGRVATDWAGQTQPPDVFGGKSCATTAAAAGQQPPDAAQHWLLLCPRRRNDIGIHCTGVKLVYTRQIEFYASNWDRHLIGIYTPQIGICMSNWNTHVKLGYTRQIRIYALNWDIYGTNWDKMYASKSVIREKLG